MINHTILQKAILIIGVSTIGFSDDIKLAQTGFQFLSVVSDARATGMGEAMTTMPGQSNAVFLIRQEWQDLPSLLQLTLAEINGLPILII